MAAKQLCVSFSSMLPTKPDSDLGSPEGGLAAKILRSVLHNGLYTRLEVRAVEKRRPKVEQLFVRGAHAVIQECAHQALGDRVGQGRSVGELLGPCHGLGMQRCPRN